MKKEVTERLVLNPSFDKMRDSKLVVWSHDENSYKINFDLSRNDCPFNLENSKPRILLIFKPNNEKYIYPLTIENTYQGKTSLTIPNEILGFEGEVHAHVYLDYEDRTHDFGHFKFDMNHSAIDKVTGNFSELYVKEFDEAVQEIKELANEYEGKYASAIEEDQAKFNSWLDEIKTIGEENDLVTRKELEMTFDEYFDVGEAIRLPFQEPIKIFKDQIDGTKFNLLIETDAHLEEGVEQSVFKQAGQYALSHANNALEIANNHCDVVVFGGDNVNSDSYGLDNCIHQLKAYADNIFDRSVDCDTFFTIGNHDSGSKRVSSKIANNQEPYITNKEIISVDTFKEAFRTKDKSFEEVRDNDSLYFYKDYPEKKIRLIVLNNSDTPDYLVNSNNGIKYLAYKYHNFGKEQIEWLITDALNVPNDLHVVVYAHAPLAPVNGFKNSLGQYGISKYFNHDIVRDILLAFKNGERFAGSTDKTEDLENVITPAEWEDFSYTVDANFIEQGKRDFVGFFAGHYHNESDYEYGGIVTHACVQSVASTTDRIIDTLSEDAKTLVEIDTTTKEVKFKGFGSSDNTGKRNYSYGNGG